MNDKKTWFRALGWKVEVKDVDGWRNIHCVLEAEVSEPRVNIRRKYSIAWNGERFADSSEIKVMRQKNPKLLASIKKALAEQKCTAKK